MAALCALAVPLTGRCGSLRAVPAARRRGLREQRRESWEVPHSI